MNTHDASPPTNIGEYMKTKGGTPPDRRCLTNFLPYLAPRLSRPGLSGVLISAYDFHLVS